MARLHERRTGRSETEVLWHRLLRRSASESGTLCRGDGGREGATAAEGRSCCLSSQHKGEQMARFVLVHGGFSGAWIWLPLIDSLKAAGHLVEGSTCRGWATTTLLRARSAGIATQAVCARCWRPIPNRPSWSATAWAALSQRKERHDVPNVSRRSYTWRPSCQRTGRVFSTKLPEGDGEQVLANVVVEGEPPVAVMPAAASRHALYGSCTEDVAAWAIAQQCPQPVSPLPVAV